MPFCTGQGHPDDPGGCCWLEGNVCPHYKSAADVVTWIDAQGWKGASKTRALNMAQGVLHACDIAISVVANDARTITDRARFEDQWRNHPQYVADVRPTWEAHEQAMGFPADSYNCGTWKGHQQAVAAGYRPPDTALVCCFAQDEATCEAQAQALHTTAVTIRRAGGF
jgi:hypothetical protein